MLRLAIVLAGLLLLAGCGSDEDGGDSPAGSSGSAPATELTVTVWPQGRGGPMRERQVECPGADVCGALSARSFAAVPHNLACTAIYRGAKTAAAVGGIAVRLRADDALDPLVTRERDDLYERRALLKGVDAVARQRDEREVDRCDVGVRVHEAAQHLEHAVGAVERRYEQAAPAGRGADRPGVVELHGRARLPGPARRLRGAVVTDHLAVELPAGRDCPALVADLESHCGRQGHDPPERHGVEERGAALDRQRVVRGAQPLLVEPGELVEPRGLDRLGRDRLGGDALVPWVAEGI